VNDVGFEGHRCRARNFICLLQETDKVPGADGLRAWFLLCRWLIACRAVDLCSLFSLLFLSDVFIEMIIFPFSAIFSYYVLCCIIFLNLLSFY
jgi:hypothetical protein